MNEVNKWPWKFAILAAGLPIVIFALFLLVTQLFGAFGFGGFGYYFVGILISTVPGLICFLRLIQKKLIKGILGIAYVSFWFFVLWGCFVLFMMYIMAQAY